MTAYKNSLGTEKEGLDTGPSFGGETIFVVPTFISYDRKKVNIDIPTSFALAGEVMILGNTLLMIDGENVLNFTVQGAKITAGYIEKIEIPKLLEATPISNQSVKLEWKRGG